jgi:hypothetical protein
VITSTVMKWVSEIFKHPDTSFAKFSVFLIFSGLPLTALVSCAFNLGYLDGLGLRIGLIGFIATTPLSVSDAWHGSISFATIVFGMIAFTFAVVCGGFWLLSPLSNFVAQKLNSENSLAESAENATSLPIQIKRSQIAPWLDLTIALWSHIFVTTLFLSLTYLIFAIFQLHYGYSFNRMLLISVLCFMGVLGLRNDRFSVLELFSRTDARPIEKKWTALLLERLGLILVAGTAAFGVGHDYAFERRLETDDSSVAIFSKDGVVRSGQGEFVPLARLSKGRLALEKDGRVSFFDIDTEDTIYFQTATPQIERKPVSGVNRVICFVVPSLDGCASGLAVRRYLKQVNPTKPA